MNKTTLMLTLSLIAVTGCNPVVAPPPIEETTGGVSGGTTGGTAGGGSTTGGTTGSSAGGSSGGTSGGVSNPEVPQSSSNVNQYLNRACELTIGVTHGNDQVKISKELIGNAKVVCIKAGKYGYFEVADLTGTAAAPIIIQNQGLVEFSYTAGLGNLKYVVISGSGTSGIEHGLVVRDTGYRGISMRGKFSYFTMQNLALINVPNLGINWEGADLVYDGTPNTAFYNNKFLRIKADKVSSFFSAGGDREAKKDLIFNLEIAYSVVTNSPNAGGVIYLSSAFNNDIHHNSFQTVGNNVNQHSGIIFLHGDGKLHHNYFKSTLGNSMRTWPLSYGSLGKLDMYNNISIDSIKYSMFEVQPFDDEIKDGYQPTNIRIYNNTSGHVNHGENLPAGSGLWTAGLVDSYYYIGGTLDIQNNLLFDVTKLQNSAYFLNGQGSWPAEYMTLKNNVYYATLSAAGLNSLESAKPKANSPVVGKGASLSLVTDDYYGVARPAGSVDIGAVQH